MASPSTWKSLKPFSEAACRGEGLGYPVGVNVEAEYATIAVGKILDEEFWHPVLVFI
jgi:hypothetical protein